MMIRKLTMWCGLLLVASTWSVGSNIATAQQQGEKVPADIGQRIAGLNQISPDLLLKIQANPEALKGIVLVDARSDDETGVSVIPGAITKEQYEANPKAYAGRTVVAYCLSGGRSGSMVRKLKAKRIPAVDLEGSILGWCQLGLPLATLKGMPTNRVYTYSSDNTVPSKYEAVY